MAKYFEAEKLIKDLKLLCGDRRIRKSWRPALEALAGAMEKQLDDLPDTDDISPRRGHWKLHNNGSGTCSVCLVLQKNVWDQDSWQNFCGHCGADMRELGGGCLDGE